MKQKCIKMQLIKTSIVTLLFLLLLSCKGPKHNTDPLLFEQEIIDPGIESFLKKMEQEEHFTGAALVMREDKVIHAKGYGMAKNGSANSVTTVFHIASITKQFTSAAILQLVERGIVNLDESINRYLPKDYRSPQWDRVTVHHALCHSSGITNYGVTGDYYQVVKGFCLGSTVDGMVKEAMRKDLEFEPGTEFSYSDINYTLLGFIIENQTQTPYSEYLQVNILDPMDMRNSKIHTTKHNSVPGEAEGYRWSNVQSAHVPDNIISLPVTEPDGGLVTTLADFVKWTGIYLGKQQTILSDSSIALMTRPFINTNIKGPGGKIQSYGYGLLIEGDLICHSGYIVGFRSDFILDRKRKILIVVFTNNTTNDPINISNGLFKLLE